MTRPVRVVYIAGTGRSGSTLVAQYLERRTTGVHVGELRYIWERGVVENHLCECREPFDRCPFWTAVLAQAYGDELALVTADMLELAPRIDRIRRIPQALTGFGAGYRADVRRYRQLLTPLYRAIASVSGAALLIDSSKDPSYLYALSVLDVDLVPVHLVRDPRAVAYSWTRRRRRPEIHWEEQYMRTLAPRRAARNWVMYNAAIEAFARRSRRAARVRYEDFANSPDASVEALCQRIDVPCLPFDASERVGHSLSGNPMRFGAGPLVVRVDEEWRTQLPASDQRLVSALTSPLMHHYGYRLRP